MSVCRRTCTATARDWILSIFFDERNVYQNSSSIATKAKPSPPGSKQIILSSRAHIDACYAMVMLQHVQN